MHQATLTTLYTTVLETLSTIADVHARAGRFESAIGVLGHARELSVDDAVPLDLQAGVLTHLGAIMAERSSFVTSHYAEALALLREALERADATANAGVQAAARNALGLAQYLEAMSRGHATSEQAAALFHEALRLAEAAGATHEACRARLHLALVAERAARFDEARAAFRQVRSMAEQHGYQQELAEAWRHLGFAHRRDGAYAEAQHCFEQSLAVWEQLEMHLFLPFAHLVLGDCFAAQGQVIAAQAQYETAYARANAVGNSRAAVQVAFSLGELAEQQGNVDTARQWYAQTLTLAEAMQFAPGIARSRAKLEEIAGKEAP